MVLCPDPEGWGPMSPVYYNFTPCFADVVLQLVLGLGLLVLSPIELRGLSKSPAALSPTNSWFYIKLGLVAFICFCNVVYITSVKSLSSGVDLRAWATLIYVAAVGMTGYVHYGEHFRARVPSAIVLMFWLLSVLTGLLRLYSQIQMRTWVKSKMSFAAFSISLLATIAQFCVVTLIPRPPSQYESLSGVIDNSPESSANIFSRVTFSYLTEFMKLGYENYLTEDSLPELPAGSRTHKTCEEFKIAWQAEKQRPLPSLARALFRCFRVPYLIGVVFKLSSDVLTFTLPNLLRQLVLFINSYNSDKPVPISGGILIAIGMFMCSFLQSLLQQQYMQRVLRMGMHMKSSLTSSIYHKALVLSSDSRSTKSTGDILNLMSVDVQRLLDITQSGQALWSGPFQILLCLYNLHALVGNSMWAGVAVTVCAILLNAYIARRQRRLQKTQMMVKDKRTRLTREFLTSIKSIKLYAWEDSFITRLNKIRNDRELTNLRKKGVYSAIANFIGSCAPFFVSCSTFAAFIWTTSRTLSTDLVFPALALFNLLSNPLAQIPTVITQLVEASVSTSRLRDFLILSELQADAVTRLDAATEAGQPVVTISNGNFVWDEIGNHSPALRNINFVVRKGQLACIIGAVGSAKSAMLQAILGDLGRTSGSVTVRGQIAYCAQVPWIMNATVKENILFGKRFDAGFYEKTVHACALLEDFDALPYGDNTIVGEKGISLSGGQKARVALARAVYTRADVYILDDPLSAVDQHVGRHLIDNVLGRQGLLAGKTKVMATNAISVLSQADNITLLREGEVVETGLFAEVMDKPNSEIYQLIKMFATEQLDTWEKTEDEKDPLATTADEEDNFEHHTGSKVDRSLRRASTASFNLPALVDANNEHTEKGQVKFGVYKDYLQAANIYIVLLFVLLMISSNIMSVGGTVWLKHWSDINTQHGSNPGTGRYLAIYLIFGVTTAFLTLFSTIVLWIFCSIEAAKKLHDQMLLHVIHSPMRFFDTTPIGRVINRFTTDIDRVDEALPRVFTGFFSVIFNVMSSLLVISFVNPPFLLFIIPLAVLYVYYQKFYLRTSRELKRLESVSRSPLFAHFQESLNGVSTIRAYSQIRRFNWINEYHIDFNNKAYYPSMIARRWLSMRLDFLGSCVIFLTALLSVLGIVSGHLSSGLIGLTMSYSFQVTSALSGIVRMTAQVEISTVSVERILEYCRLPCEAPGVIDNNRPPADWPAEGSVQFHDYSTRYRIGLDLVLKGINLHIKSGEKVGVVGRTGAGKSSLTLGLFRMIEPVGGFISIDGINTSKLGLKDLRQRLAIIPQDSHAFEGTVRENLDPSSKHTDAELWHVLELSHMKIHIQGMEGRLDAKVNECGSNFSVGQRQLMSLARALLTSSKVLVMDEATAAVDVETDQIIQETIRKEFKDRTIFTIAHRLNTIIDSDRIVVLAAGKVMEFDAPEKLLENKSSLFYALCKQGGLAE
ncbi:P-loop containing nucleoside triphosphate hydrolase protein [Lipomyces doorenjongii]|uniref:P-loop containing nucleoside triphosphate hydrolase protein n=1 Tax=Lipomyces doorenjongii TaxID=383834 RepID=UPI0034CF3934